ncbi:phytanoyl-CoA dioxygenase family protein [Sorangium sp. So ce1389]|uniref:phytanoyl-CoA dioxygenase family protein n=1 Tax=Sorangium sp. So ce1389 TaxID=3133336 RepID=UPI003F622239
MELMVEPVASPLPEPPPWSAARARLLSEGYAVIPGVLGQDEVRRYHALARGILAPQRSREYQEKHVAIGSLLDILRDPGFVDLIGHPRALAALRGLGFDEPRYLHGIVFNKLPRTPRTFWHQDCTFWSDPVAYEPEPRELILIYYLVDTTPHNGCLRVIPGSHLRRHRLHEPLRGACIPELESMRDPCSPAFQSYPDEVSIPVNAGDLVIVDVRLLHATHANDSDAERTALSLWYIPACRDLPERVRARLTLRTGVDERLPYVPAGWPEDAAARLRALLPAAYEGSAAPLPWHTDPDERLC